MTARLFTDRGPHATTAEKIADARGAALRTFYRYFRTDEDAVAPLLIVGAERGLRRARGNDPALMNVWCRANRESETELRAVIRELAG